MADGTDYRGHKTAAIVSRWQYTKCKSQTYMIFVCDFFFHFRFPQLNSI